MSKAAKRSSLTDHPNLRSALNTEQSLSLRLSFSHPLTFYLHLSPDVLPPRFQYAVLHLSFLRRFHLPSLYISLTHFPGVFALFFFKFLFFFTAPPLLHPFAVPLPLKQSSFFLSLFIYMTPRFSQRQVRMAKGRLFTKRFRFNIFPLLFITTQELHGRTNSPLLIALSFCKYHGPSLIFILLPPLSLRTPSVDQYRLGSRASRR